MRKLHSLFILFLSFCLYAQTPNEFQVIKSQNNNKNLNSLAENYKSKFSKEELQKLSYKMGWEYEYNEDDSFIQLIGINEDNTPIYYKTYNKGAGITSRANTLYTGGSLGLDVHGENMLSGVWDGGAGLTTHELLAGRITVKDGATGSSSHGTHVIGTVIGTDAVESGNARGMAFKASVDSYDWFSDLSEVAVAASNGLLLSNHSYGYKPETLGIHRFGKYDNDSRGFDEVMFNAPYYQAVYAAGNTRNAGINTGDGGYDLITGHALSKNGITVAAVNSVLNYKGPTDVVMSSFSSWGPTDDGRIKPDISAKGVNTYSSVNKSNNSYSSFTGTSMASPSTNGTLLLIQQYYNQKNSNYMRAATLRGLMIHSADEAGDTDGPDYEFGWGLINAERMGAIIKNENQDAYIEEKTLNQSEIYNDSYTATGSEPLAITICWTDPPGTPTNNSVEDDPEPMLINDLDIRLVKNGATYYPWKLDVANPAVGATKGDNVLDNVEKIEILNPNGSYALQVSHKGTLLDGTQNYSIIVSGATKNNFWFDLEDYTQLNVCQNETSTTAQLNISRASGFTEDITLSALNLPGGVSATFTPTTLTNETSFNAEITGFSSLSTGEYPFKIKGVSTSGDYEFDATLIVSDTTPGMINLLTPTNGENLGLPISFSWSSDANALEYLLEIATDNSFTNIVRNETVIGNTQINIQGLNPGSKYFWRVTPNNGCGNGPTSSIFSFTTTCDSTVSMELSSRTTNELILQVIDNSTSSWEIEYVLEGENNTGNGQNYTTTTPSFANLTSNTCYDFYIRENCDLRKSDWNGPFTFCTKPNYCGGDHFYDSGGVSGNYSNNENWTETIYPVNSDEKISVTFNSFDLELDFDFLTIFNGPDENAPLLYNGSGTTSPGTLTSTHETGSLTFLFISDEALTRPGWDATINCNPLSISNFDENEVGIAYFPNPVNTVLKLQSGSYNVTQYNLMDISGRYIKKNVEVNNKEFEINFKGLNPGIYFIKMNFDSNKTKTIRIIKN